MATTNRPLSPHLQVYRLPMLALLSITHRATGVFLSVAALIFPVILITLAYGPETYSCTQSALSAWYGRLFLFLVSFSLLYHMFNGIRHLFWDIGKNLEVKDAEFSGYLVIIASLLLTIVVWSMAYYYGGAA